MRFEVLSSVYANSGSPFVPVGKAGMFGDCHSEGASSYTQNILSAFMMHLVKDVQWNKSITVSVTTKLAGVTSADHKNISASVHKDYSRLKR